MSLAVDELVILDCADADGYKVRGNFYAHRTSCIDLMSVIGDNTTIWHFTHVSHNAKIGKDCSIGQGCYIGPNVVIGDNVRIQNNVSVYEGVTIGDDCFIGPSAVFTNCHLPVPGTKQPIDKTVIGNDCVIGANATIIAPCKIAMGTIIGAGSVVTSGSYEPHTFVGNPAKPK